MGDGLKKAGKRVVCKWGGGKGNQDRLGRGQIKKMKKM